MPPKAAGGPSKKTEQKQKAKIIEDKTFGLKNKNKSTKVSKYVEAVEKQVKEGVSRKAAKEADALKVAQQKKKEDEKAAVEMAALFKPVVQQQKVPFGVDPKTVVCAFFKASGTCAKGVKCKFSHDLSVERKSAKINLYTDARDEDFESMEKDTMDTWDTEKLESVVLTKHGPGIKTTTDIVCKFFLDAIEQRKYGWFWECPNGGSTCKYRHCLPPGFVLKSQLASTGDEEEKISLEEFLEKERFNCDKKTPVTAESFAKWKAQRVKKHEEEAKKRDKAKEAQVKAGRLGHVSGRDLFQYQPDLFRDDEEAMDVDYSAREDMWAGTTEQDAGEDHDENQENDKDDEQREDVLIMEQGLFEDLDISDDDEE